jgi:hypothetical protein
MKETNMFKLLASVLGALALICAVGGAPRLAHAGTTGCADGQVLGAVGGVLGCVLTPTVSNVNVNANTLPANGLYLPSANTLGFAINSTNCGHMDGSTGFELVLGCATSTGQSIYLTGSGGNFGKFAADTNGLYITSYGPSSGWILFQPNAAIAMLISPNLHVEKAGAAPVITTGSSDCGTSPSVLGNDQAARITVGSSANGGKCTDTFNKSWQHNPICTVLDETTAVLLRPVTTTTTLVINGAIVAGDTLAVQCEEYQ